MILSVPTEAFNRFRKHEGLQFALYATREKGLKGVSLQVRRSGVFETELPSVHVSFKETAVPVQDLI